MITLYLKFEKSTLISHLLIVLPEVTNFFYVSHISYDITAAKSEYDIEKISHKNDGDGSTYI